MNKKSKQLYFAPLEGITGYVLRNAYETCFPGNIDKYFAPFIAASARKVISSHDIKDILPESNSEIYLVPQLLTNSGTDFISTAGAIKELGYQELNLNLGCPSKTVVTKKKGAGLLAYPQMLNTLLEDIYTWADSNHVKISIKTRIGMDDPEEFAGLLNLYNQYPVSELIIHPRTQSDYYQNSTRMGEFRYAMTKSVSELCYNGDLSDEDKLQAFMEEYPQVHKIMIGRGFLMHPGRIRKYCNERIKNEKISNQKISNDKDCLWSFHDEVYEGYKRTIQGEKNILFKMKELWAYMEQGQKYHELPETKRLLKQLRKCERLTDYDSVIRQLRLK